MKKYILKRDLPHCKAGEEFILKENGNLYGIDGGIVYNYITLEKFDILNNTEWFEEVIEKPNSVWDLKIGDKYYTFSSYDKKITEYPWSNYGFDIYTRDLGNVFLTEKEARKELNKRIAIQKIKRYCWEKGINTEYRLGRTEICKTRFGEIKLKSVENYFVPNPIGYFHEYEAKKILDNFEEELKIILE